MKSHFRKESWYLMRDYCQLELEGRYSYLEIIAAWIQYGYFFPFILYVHKCACTHACKENSGDHEFRGRETDMAGAGACRHRLSPQHRRVVSPGPAHLSRFPFRRSQPRSAWTAWQWITSPYLKWSVIPSVSAGGQSPVLFGGMLFWCCRTEAPGSGQTDTVCQERSCRPRGARSGARPGESR